MLMSHPDILNVHSTRGCKIVGGVGGEVGKTQSLKGSGTCDFHLRKQTV